MLSYSIGVLQTSFIRNCRWEHRFQMTSILAQFEAADTSSGRVSVFEELLSLASDAPERIEPFLTLIQNAFVEPMPDLRRLAFQCAIKYVSANPSVCFFITYYYSLYVMYIHQRFLPKPAQLDGERRRVIRNLHMQSDCK